jgi:hypothetical protein
MSRIYWDTNLFIYLFEDYGALAKAVGQLRSKMLGRGDQLLTSTSALREILVKPTPESALSTIDKQFVPQPPFCEPHS